MYESTMDALRHLYPRLAPGGFCIIDDYCLVNCRKAVHDYREREGIAETIQEIDGVGIFWRKIRGMLPRLTPARAPDSNQAQTIS